MTTPPQPPVSGKPAVNTQELGFWVRNWAHYNDQATALYRQTVNSRKVRDEFETKILDTLRTNNMENAVIQITGGKLSVHEERHNQPLTLQRIEELLRLYYQSKQATDESANILKFIRKHRGFEVHKRLKKQVLPIVPPLAPLPPLPPLLGPPKV